MQDHNHTIDVVKGIAILLIIFTHFEWTPEQRKSFFFLFVVNMAIPVFMIITGYVYSLSLARSGIRHAEDAYRTPLIIKRLIRYTIPMIAVIIWEIVDPHFNVLAMTRGQLLAWAIDGTVGKGSYYYPVMMQLVFFFPVIYFIINVKRETGLIICMAFNAVYELLAWAYGLNPESYRLLVFRYTFVIAAGVFASKKYKIGRACSVLMTLTGAAFIIAIGRMNYAPRILNREWATTNFLSSMLIVPAMVWVLQEVRMCFAPLEVLGRASYHIFLAQMIYYGGYYSILKEKIGSRPGLLAAGMALCVAAGVLFYYVEKPVQDRVIRRIAGGRTAR